MAEQRSTTRAGRTAPDICPGLGRAGLSRATARSPARRPISSAGSRSSRWRAPCQAWSRCMVAPSPAMHRRRAAVAGRPIGAGKAAGRGQSDGRTPRRSRPAPLELVTPATAQRGALRRRAPAREARRIGGSRSSSPSRIGDIAAHAAARRGRARRRGLRAPRAPSPGSARPASASASSGQVGRSGGRRALADEQPQADLLAFRPADLLELAEAHLDAARPLADVERVGGGGAGGDCRVRPALRQCGGRRSG